MIIDRYVTREILAPFFRVITVLLVIFTGYVGALFLGQAGEGALPASVVFPLIGLKMVIGMEVLLPTAFYLGVVIGLGRLYSDSEMTVLLASGVSETRVMRPVLKLGLWVAVVVAGLSLYANPWAYRTGYELEAKALASFDLMQSSPGASTICALPIRLYTPIESTTIVASCREHFSSLAKRDARALFRHHGLASSRENPAFRHAWYFPEAMVICWTEPVAPIPALALIAWCCRWVDISLKR